LDRGEQRVLFVTFVGGGASIVVAAAIVGGAIALGHVYRNLKTHHAAGFAEGGKIFGYVTGGLIVLAVGSLWLIFTTDRFPRLLAHRMVGRIALVLAVVFSLSTLVMVLTVIGLAAGVK
jgi:hypothetical protein